MKKLYFLLLFIPSISVFSQKDYSRYYNSWRLGLNLGGAWQTADYRSCWGIAGGITLEKGFHENATNFFSFAIRGRYLGASTYGMDYNRNYDVKSNDAYNGKYDSKVNYVDSVSVAKQYVYDNYKMKLGEGSLELQVTFNRLREQTHVLLNLWGGIGFTSYRTKSDLLNGDNKMYDFSLIDSTGNRTKALSTYNGLIDKNYESNAYGSKNGNLVTFSPSLGIGLGYQFSPGFSMLWEYKVTFPQGTNADLLDGKLAANKDFFGSNDYYHYTGLNLVFTLRGKHKTTTPKDETVYTNTVVPTNTVAVPTTSIVPPTNTVVTYIPPTQIPVTEVKPLVTFITPATNGLVVNTQQYKISAQVLNISSVNQIQFKFNGINHYNFNYNAQSHILEYNATLNNGVNTAQIIAANNAGQDNASTSVIYEHPKAAVAPVVTYINPAQPGAVSAAPAYQIKAQVLNVSGQNEISVYYNGLSIPFTYDATTKQATIPVNLNPGSNSISITANNSGGEDTKASSIVFKEKKALPAGLPPAVNLINPATTLNATDNLLYNFKLSVLNVAAKTNIELLFNGVAQTNFTYDPNTKEVFFQTNLIIGNNSVSVKGTNQYGSDVKVISVNYTPHAEIKIPPVVTISNPVNSTATVSNPNYTYKAIITNVPNASGLTVKFNGSLVTNYVYDGLNLSYNTGLSQGNNSFEVSAHNNDGSDTKTAVVNYKLKVVPVLPVVNLINPASQTNASDNVLYNFKLAVLNVNSKSDIEVLFNGNPQTNFTYDFNMKEVFFQTNLIAGNNTLSVKGTNQFGSDVKQVDVSYTPQLIVKVPPVITFLNPANLNGNTQDANYIFTATITQVESASGLTVKYNGNVITNFTYDGTNFGYPATLNPGANNLEISASNADGKDTKTASVNFRQKIIVPHPPIVTILQPTGNPKVQVDSYNFIFKAQNVSQSQVEVTLNGSPVTQFSFGNNVGSFTGHLVKDMNTLTVKATNQDGSEIKSESLIFYVAPVIDTARNANTSPTGTSTSTTQGNSSNKTVEICHIVAGGSPQTITIPINLLPMHLGHGDTKGACPVKTDSVNVAPVKTVPIRNNSSEEKPNTEQKDTTTKQPNITPRKPR